MDEMMAMMEQDMVRTQGKSLCDLLQATANHFRSGDDTAGIKGLLSAAAELERLVVADRNLRQPQIDLNRLLLSLRKLYFYIHNQDITGISDFLEDSLYPLMAEWQKGCCDR